MTAAAMTPRTPARTAWRDLAWVGAAVFPLALVSRLLESPGLGGAAVAWATPVLAAVLATAPRRHWAALVAAGLLALGLALLLGGDGAATATRRAAVFGVEAVIAATLAADWLARSAGATTPLTFCALLGAVALLPTTISATLAATLHLPAGLPAGPGEFATRWLGLYASDSYAMLGMFPLALALRRQPLRHVERRQAAITLLLAAVVTLVTALSVLHLPRPFAFFSLVLGSAALVAGPRTRVLLVWACLACVAFVTSHLGEKDGAFALEWVELNLFLPGMATALPILVLSVALQRSRQATDVLQRSRERFKRLYDRAPVMLQSLDETGHTIEVNAQWLATLGYDSSDDVRGWPLARFLMPDDTPPQPAPADAAAPLQRRLLAADSRKLHVRLRTARGRAIDTLASAASVPDDDEAMHGVVLAFEDISVELAMRGEIERERDQLAALTSATGDPSMFLDRELRYRSVNRAFERFWSVSREGVVGRRPHEAPGQAAFAAEIAAPLARALAGEAVHLQVTLAGADGPRVVEAALAPAFDARGDQAGVVATLHDVTDRVAATRELRQLVDELQHANEGLEQFARIASHDLREPLNTILQFAGLIEEDFGAQLPPEATRYFALMAKASVRMKAMLDAVLQFARLERLPHVRLEAVPLERVFAELATLLHERVAQAGARLQVATPLPVVRGQQSLLELLFQHLLTNALRYTAPGMAPSIDVSAERADELIVVTIADNGVGIAPHELERVFVPFHKLRTWQQADGSGLGLAICRRIATALGGRVWAESQEGHGSRFRVALQAAGAAAPGPAPDQAGGRRT